MFVLYVTGCSVKSLPSFSPIVF